MLAAALSYAERGWPVLPLHSPTGGACSCRKPTCSSVGKHPRTHRGLKAATTDARKIRQWWTQWPQANIGILTGAGSGLVVLDVDDKGEKQGSHSLALRAADGHEVPTTFAVRTGNGRHLYFKHPGIPVANSVQKLGAGLDVRGEDGYVVAAPSAHANGQTYEVESCQELADAPSWIVAAIAKKEKVKGVMNEEEFRNNVPVVAEGERNDTLYKLACSLRGQHGMERGQIEPILLHYNDEKCDPPLDADEIFRIAETACKFPAELKGKKSAKRQEENPLYWFKFNLRDFFSDERLNIMTDYQTGWHTRLIAFAWQRGGFLPADRKTLYKLARAKSLKAFNADCDIVLADFEEVTVNDQPMLKNREMAARYSHTLQDWMKKKEAGEASRAARINAARPTVAPTMVH
jgi:hypothetical protein